MSLLFLIAIPLYFFIVYWVLFYYEFPSWFFAVLFYNSSIFLGFFLLALKQ